MSRKTRKIKRKKPTVNKTVETTTPTATPKPRGGSLWKCMPIALLLFVGGLTAAFQGAGAETVKAKPQAAATEQTSIAKPSLTPETLVMAYVGGKDDWQPKQLKELAKGQEFQFDNHLCYVDQNGLIRMNPDVDIVRLPEADRTYDKNDSHFPEPKDVVRFIGEDNKHLRHDRMGTLQAKDRFFFQGRLYEAIEAKDSPTGLSLHKTDIVLSRVTDTFKRQTDTLIDLTIVDGTGKERVISGTPEHPFFVPAVGDYVAMGKLQPDTILKTDDGSLATVKSSKTRTGDFTVYNFEVEGMHNYFVASADGGPMVNVHNQCKISPKKLQKKFKHAGDFGVHGNYNKANAQKFQEAIRNHVTSSNTKKYLVPIEVTQSPIIWMRILA